MFESISVSERTRKPWTVLVSCAGQCVMIGLFVLIPLVTRQALPHGRLAGLHQGHAVNVMAFGDHLRADEHIEFAFIERV